MRRKWLPAVVLAAALAVIGGGVVLAQDGGSSGTSFLDRVAAKLGVQRSQLDQAIKDARSEQIDEAVRNGDITQERADALKQRLDELPADAPFFAPRVFGGEFKIGHGFRLGLCASAKLDDLAQFLGIDVRQLRDELAADGATLASVADAHGKSRDELKAFLLGNIRERLDQAVADGRMTQERADEFYANAESNIDDLIDRKPPAAGHFRFRHGDDDEDNSSAPSQRFQRRFSIDSQS